MINVQVGQQIGVIVQQDHIGGRSVTWQEGILWQDGIVPVSKMIPAKRDVYTIKSIAPGVFLGFVAGSNF